MAKLHKRMVREGIYPTRWKISRVVPPHKRGSVKFEKNYRPLAMLVNLPVYFGEAVGPQSGAWASNFVPDIQFGFTDRAVHECPDTQSVPMVPLEQAKQNAAVDVTTIGAIGNVKVFLLLPKLNTFAPSVPDSVSFPGCCRSIQNISIERHILQHNSSTKIPIGSRCRRFSIW